MMSREHVNTFLFIVRILYRMNYAMSIFYFKKFKNILVDNNSLSIKNATMDSVKFIGFLRDWVIIAIGVFVAAHVVDGITYDSGSALLVAVLLLSVFNIFLKPVLVLITLPLIVLTFGLLLWVINALLFLLAGSLVDGFHVDSFVSALWGALIVSLVAILANMLFGGRGNGRSSSSGRGPSNKSDRDDVIDI